MIEILAELDENKISAQKIFRDLNEDEKIYIMEMIAEEMPAMALMAVGRATQCHEKKLKAMEDLATRKYEVMMND